MSKSNFFLISVLAASVFAEQSGYSDINRTLYDTPRSRAMGGSILAVSRDAVPSGLSAGIVNNDRTELYVGYSGVYQNLFGATTTASTHPIDEVQGIGASVSYLMVPGIDSVEAAAGGDGVPIDPVITEETGSELYINLVYGRSLHKSDKVTLAAGGSVHMKRQRIVDWTGYGLGADVSFQSLFASGAALALKVDNIFTEYTHWSQNYYENGLPRMFFGAAFDKELTQKFGITTSYRSPDLFANSGVGGGAFTTDGQFEDEPQETNVWKKPSMFFTYGNWGAEFRIMKAASIRTGFSDTRMLSFGGGAYLFDRWNVDFVYSHSNALEGTYSLGTTFKF